MVGLDRFYMYGIHVDHMDGSALDYGTDKSASHDSCRCHSLSLSQRPNTIIIRLGICPESIQIYIYYKIQQAVKIHIRRRLSLDVI